MLLITPRAMRRGIFTETLAADRRGADAIKVFVRPDCLRALKDPINWLVVAEDMWTKLALHPLRITDISQ
jgi:hypothetical protein